MTSTPKIIKYTYVGRTTNFKGKTLWEIVGSLKNFGVGRLITRSIHQRYSEPSFMKIVKVEANPDEETRKVKVWVERTFRGRTIPQLIPIHSVSYKPDYCLIPKHEEEQLIKKAKETPPLPEKILPNKIDMPPLLKEFMVMNYNKKDITENIDFTMPITYSKSLNRTYKVAKDGETPTIKIPMGLGKPANPLLYEGLKLEK